MSFTSMEIGGVRYNGHMQAGIYSFFKDADYGESH